MEARQHDIGRDVDEADPAARQKDTADAASQRGGIILRHRRPVAAEEVHAARSEWEQAATEVGKRCRPSGVPRIHERELSSPQTEIYLRRQYLIGIAPRLGSGEFE